MSEFFSQIAANLGDNPYFGAGFGLVGVGAALAASKRALVVGTILFRRHFMMTLEITHRDQSYPWVLSWLTHKYKHAQHLSVDTKFVQRDSGKIISQFNLLPSVGTHYFAFEDKWMKIDRDRQQTSVNHLTGVPFETIKFTCLGKDKTIFNRMLSYARDLEASKHDGKTVIYVPKTDSWEPFGEPRRQRQFDSVILESDLSERILKDVNEFLASREWYAKRGIPYRRGYLLHGPPGCGKTSFIVALAAKLDYDICQMNLSAGSMSDDRLGYLLNVAPLNSIILLEDIDAAFFSREGIDYDLPKYEGMRTITLSGILNMLDGVMASEERIIFMTTNYPERLDPAMTRPGRVDMKAYIGYATNEQLARAFDKFYPPELSHGSQAFVRAVENARSKVKAKQKINLSMADVQSYFLLHKDRPEDAIRNVEKLISAKIAPLTAGKSVVR